MSKMRKILSALFISLFVTLILAKGVYADNPKIAVRFSIMLPDGSMVEQDLKGLIVSSMTDRTAEDPGIGISQSDGFHYYAAGETPGTVDFDGDGIREELHGWTYTSCYNFAQHVPYFPSSFNSSSDIFTPASNVLQTDISHSHFYQQTFTSRFPWFQYDATNPRGSATSYWEADLHNGCWGNQWGNDCSTALSLSDWLKDEDGDTRWEKECENGAACTESYPQLDGSVLCAACQDGKQHNKCYGYDSEGNCIKRKIEIYYNAERYQLTGWPSVTMNNRIPWYGQNTTPRIAGMPLTASEVVYDSMGGNFGHGYVEWVLKETSPDLFTVSGNVYCKADNVDGTQTNIPIENVSINLYHHTNSPQNYTLTSSSGGSFTKSGLVKTGAIAVKINDFNSVTDTTTFGTKNYNTSNMTLSSAVNCSSVSGCTYSDPATYPGCGGSSGPANNGSFEHCGITDSDAGPFNFELTNCPEIPSQSYDCTDKSSDKAEVNPDGTITYTVHYTSSGVDNGNLWVLDKLDSDVEFVSFASTNPVGVGPGFCSYHADADSSFPSQVNTGHFIACQPRTVAEGDIIYTVSLKSGVTSGTVTNQAYVGILDGQTWSIDGTGCDNSVTVVTHPTISCVDKVVSPTTANVGDALTYTITYTIGESSATNISFVDKYDTTHITNVVPSNLPSGVCTTIDGVVNCNNLTVDKNGNSLITEGNHTITFTATTKASGTGYNYIESLTGNFNGTNVVGTGVGSTSEASCYVPVTINNPEAACTNKKITKINGVANTETTPTIDPGDEVEFTINYTFSDVAANSTVNILVTDPFPTGFELTPTSVTPGTPTCTVAGEEDTYTVRCNIEKTADSTGSGTGTVVILATAKEDVRDLLTTNRATVRLDINDDGVADDDAPGVTENQACSTAPELSTGGATCSYKNASAGYDEAHPAKPGDIVDYTVGFQATKAPVDLVITEEIPENLTILQTYVSTCTRDSLTDNPMCSQNNFADLCSITNDVLTCNLSFYGTGDYTGTLTYHAQISATEIPVDGATITNEVYVYEEGNPPQEGDENPDECDETIYVEHEAPSCVATTPSVMTIRVADLAGTTVSLSTTGTLGTHSDLDFRWTATCGTLSNTEWHVSNEDPNDGTVSDTVTWTPPTDGTEGETCDLKVYVRPTGSTDATGVSDDDCESTATITALDLVCNWLVPNDEYQYFPFDMTFAADIGGDQSAAFSYDLDFGDGSTHYTGTGTVASGTTVELPYIPPQDQPHTYDSDTPTNFAPSLTVTNTETGETSVCPTVLAGLTQSSWSIVKDSDVDTCVAENSTVTYTIVVTNTGDYTADLAEVRDTLDSKVDTSTLTNIRECDSNGLNCTTYNKADVLDGRTITWPGRTFTAGESRRYLYTVTISSAGDYYNVAEAIPEAGETVRDDELFPTCKGKAPETGVMTTAALVAILGVMIVAAGTYAYKTEAGAQIVANVLGKTGRAIRKTTHRKESFERDVIKSSKDKLKD